MTTKSRIIARRLSFPNTSLKDNIGVSSSPRLIMRPNPKNSIRDWLPEYLPVYSYPELSLHSASGNGIIGVIIAGRAASMKLGRGICSHQTDALAVNPRGSRWDTDGVVRRGMSRRVDRHEWRPQSAAGSALRLGLEHHLRPFVFRSSDRFFRGRREAGWKVPSRGDRRSRSYRCCARLRLLEHFGHRCA